MPYGLLVVLARRSFPPSHTLTCAHAHLHTPTHNLHCHFHVNTSPSPTPSLSSPTHSLTHSLTHSSIPLTAKKKPLDQVFNCGPFPIGGDEDTVALASGLTREILSGNYDASGWGVSHRRVVDMRDKMNNSYVALAPGNIANLASRFFASDMQRWLDGKLRPMCHVVHDGVCASVAELVLSPNA
jgi:Penicillin amidase